MIRVSKSDAVPTSLSTSSQYNGEDVVRQLCADQHQKCYLCERTCITDYEVEHWHSKANYPSGRKTGAICCSLVVIAMVKNPTITMTL